jgi:hypothetical protein
LRPTSVRTADRAAAAGVFLTIVLLPCASIAQIEPAVSPAGPVASYERISDLPAQVDPGTPAHAYCCEASAMLPDAPAMGRDRSSAAISPRDVLGLSTSADADKSMADAIDAPLLEASRTQKLIQPGQTAPALNARDKVIFGIGNSVDTFAALGWLLAAEYEQVQNNSPNYGTDRGAYGERLGIAAVRDISESIVTDSAMAPWMHEDPRYYRLGSAHSLPIRIVYAITRPLITRADSGRTTANFAFLSGNLAGAALTNLYYPHADRGGIQTLETFGGSVGGTAFGNFVREFFGDFAHMFGGHQR